MVAANQVIRFGFNERRYTNIFPVLRVFRDDDIPDPKPKSLDLWLRSRRLHERDVAVNDLVLVDIHVIAEANSMLAFGRFLVDAANAQFGNIAKSLHSHPSGTSASQGMPEGL